MVSKGLEDLGVERGDRSVNLASKWTVTGGSNKVESRAYIWSVPDGIVALFTKQNVFDITTVAPTTIIASFLEQW